MKKMIHVGYEIPHGKAVGIPLSHLIVTGVTQLSGKTTTLEALISRSELSAIVFKTKPGEGGFSDAPEIAPFLKEQSDWQYVTSLLEATLRERMKFQRSWIMRVCKGTNSLIQVKRNIDTELANPKVQGLNRSIFTELEEYFKIILPQIQAISFSQRLITDPKGLNVMDLTRMSPEVQSLVIRSVLEETLHARTDTTVIIPECWNFIPQGRGNPVKLAAERFIRQGAANGNYLWLDSQDISSVDKIPLKSVSTWILGIQSERNEVEHTIAQMPIPKSRRPDPDMVMSLGLGQFYVCTPELMKKTYVQPSWLSSTLAEAVARGNLQSGDIKKPAGSLRLPLLAPSHQSQRMPNAVFGAESEVLKETIQRIRQDFEEQLREIRTELNSKLARIDSLKSEILASIPKNGNATYTIEPLKALQKHVLEEAKAGIIGQLTNLPDQKKKIVRFIESAQKGVNQKELLDKCLGLSGTSGGNQKMIRILTQELERDGLAVRDDNHALTYPGLLKRLESDLAIHGATKEEISQVYDHLIASLIG